MAKAKLRTIDPDNLPNETFANEWYDYQEMVDSGEVEIMRVHQLPKNQAFLLLGDDYNGRWTYARLCVPQVISKYIPDTARDKKGKIYQFRLRNRGYASAVCKENYMGVLSMNEQSQVAIMRLQELENEFGPIAL